MFTSFQSFDISIIRLVRANAFMNTIFTPLFISEFHPCSPPFALCFAIFLNPSKQLLQRCIFAFFLSFCGTCQMSQLEIVKQNSLILAECGSSMVIPHISHIYTFTPAHRLSHHYWHFSTNYKMLLRNRDINRIHR